MAVAPVSPARREFRVTVLNGHNHGQTGNSDNAQNNGNNPANSTGFQSLESHRPTAFNGTGGAEKRIGEPRVTLQRDGDRVTHLRIQCTCGQVMDLACVYDPPPPAA